MGMSYWMKLVGIISVFFNFRYQAFSLNKDQVYRFSIFIYIRQSVQSKQFDGLIKIEPYSKIIPLSASLRFGFPNNRLSNLSGRKFLKQSNKTKRWLIYI